MGLMAFSYLLLAVLCFPYGTAKRPSAPVLLPVEVLGDEGATVDRTLDVTGVRAERAYSTQTFCSRPCAFPLTAPWCKSGYVSGKKSRSLKRHLRSIEAWEWEHARHRRSRRTSGSRAGM